MGKVQVETDIPQVVNYVATTVNVGATTTLPAGSDATVTNSGTEQNAILDFGIPKGADGSDGADGKSAYEQAVEGGYEGTEEEFEAALASDIATVASNISDVNAVGQSITDVNSVAGSLTDISTVATNVTNVNTVAGISSDVTSVASISSAVSTVASHDTEVLLVSDNMASVMTTASSIGDVNTVAGIATDVSNVADNNTNITTVASDLTNIDTAATNIAAIIAAPTAATNAATSASNAQKWAEGSDADVIPLGGEHSSKGWANVAKQYAESIGTALKYKGSVSSYSALPSTGQEVGDMWNVLDTGKNYAWNGTEWDDLAGIVDLSAYRTAANQDLIDAGKQDTITDLATIRSGASAGATAVQPGDLATVATSGSYTDLLNQPTIPTVNNATITVTQGGTTKGTFTLNQSSNATIALDAGGGSSDGYNKDNLLPGEGIEFNNVTKEVNLTVEGTPTIENFVASNFSDENRLYHTNLIKDATTSFAIVTAVKMDTAADSNQGIIDSTQTSSTLVGIRLTTSNSNTVRLRVSTQGGTTYPVDITGSTTLTVGTKYYIKATYNSSTGYALYTSTDGSTWTTEGTSSETTKPYIDSVGHYFGDNSASNLYLTGSIYLEDTYVEVDGVKTWEAVKTVDKTYVTNKVANAFTPGNLKAGTNISLTDIPSIDSHDVLVCHFNGDVTNSATAYTINTPSTTGISYTGGKFGQAITNASGYNGFSLNWNDTDFNAIRYGWTVDFWIKKANTPTGYQNLFTVSGNNATQTSFYYYIQDNTLKYSFSGSSYTEIDISSVGANEWFHFAITLTTTPGVQSGYYIKAYNFYVNGIKQQQSYTPSEMYIYEPTIFSFQTYGATVDELRVSAVVRYTADFEVPTEPYGAAVGKNINCTVIGLPSQTGQSGKFLTTDGTDASWSDKPLVNAATGSNGLAILGTSTGVNGTALGVGTTGIRDFVAVGASADGHSAGVAIGYNAKTTNASVSYPQIAIGYGAVNDCTTGKSIQLGSGTNSDANTFKVANGNGNFEIMSADGTIPEARLADTTNAAQGQVLALDSNLNAAWTSAGANKDLSNLTDAGNIVSAHASMPSNTYDNLTIGASGTSYTAPADGWFWLGGISDNVSENTKVVMRRVSGSFGVSFGTQGEFLTGGWCGGVLPVKKGDVVFVFHINITTDHALRFYYAEGSVSEKVS